MMRYLAACIYLWGLPILLRAQSAATDADTTSAGYKVGYTIGEWLPFIILIILVLMVMFRARKLSKD